MSSLSVQIGGTHYQRLPMQPIELIVKVNFNFIQGNICKYLSRYLNKNGLEDLQKAFHYAQLGLDLQPQNTYIYAASSRKHITEYVKVNGFEPHFKDVLLAVANQQWDILLQETQQLINTYEAVH